MPRVTTSNWSRRRLCHNTNDDRIHRTAGWTLSYHSHPFYWAETSSRYSARLLPPIRTRRANTLAEDTQSKPEDERKAKMAAQRSRCRGHSQERQKLGLHIWPLRIQSWYLPLHAMMMRNNINPDSSGRRNLTKTIKGDTMVIIIVFIGIIDTMWFSRPVLRGL